MTLTANQYRPRRPQDSDYYSCVEDYVESFVQIYVDKNFLFVSWSIFSRLLYVKKIWTTRYRRWMI